jgi:DNA-binding CsgD family transcriptional regulator
MAVTAPGTMTVAMRMPGRASPLSVQAGTLYRALLRNAPLPAARLSEVVAESGGAALDQLVRLGLIREGPRGLVAVPRVQAIDELLAEQATLLQRALDDVLVRHRRIRALLEAGPELDGDGGERIDAVPSPAGSDASLYALPTRASRELMAIHPGDQFASHVLEQSLRRAEASVNSGVRLRVVHQSGALARKNVVGYLQALEEIGAWVRLRENVPFRLLLIDRKAAVCAAPSSGPGEDDFVVRGERLVTLLERVFETTWADSTPFRKMMATRSQAPGNGRDEVVGPRSGRTSTASTTGSARGAGLDEAALVQRYALLTSQQQLILRCLAEGETDRMIARRVGVTSRTVTRRIAEIYQELQVESRFQAGVVAHRLGLV